MVSYTAFDALLNGNTHLFGNSIGDDPAESCVCNHKLHSLHEGRSLEAGLPIGLMAAHAPLALVISITLPGTSTSVVTSTSSALHQVHVSCSQLIASKSGKVSFLCQAE